MEADLEQRRLEVQRWKEAASYKAMTQQRTAEEVLRRKEEQHDRERRVLDGALKAARAREEEGVRMAMEDRDAAIRRAVESADGSAFELRVEMQRRADVALQEQREQADRALEQQRQEADLALEQQRQQADFALEQHRQQVSMLEEVRVASPLQ